MDLSSIVRSFGTLSLLNFARKTAEKLRRGEDEELVALADSVQGAVDSLDMAYAARRPLTALWSGATAAKDAADSDLDGSIGALSYDLLSPANLKGDRKHPDYRALFPAGNIQFIHGPDRAEVVQVNAIIAYLKAHPEHPMADRAVELEVKAAAMDAALDPVSAAESALRAAQAVEKEKRNDLGRTLRKTLAILRAHFMDEKKVERFFPTVAESKVQEDEGVAAAM